jgi:hypothetical protein
MKITPIVKSNGLRLPSGTKLLYHHIAPKSNRYPAQDRWVVGELKFAKNGSRLFVCEESIHRRRNKKQWGIYDWSEFAQLSDSDYVLWKLENV